MPKTNEVISIIRDEIGTQYTREKIREALDRSQIEILGEDNALMRIVPDPFFATTDGVYSYTASNVIYDSSDGTQGATQYDIRTVREIYSFDSDVSIFDLQTIDPASDKPNQVQAMPTTDRVSARIDVKDSLRPNNTDCLVKWWEGNNPGTTTTTWRARCYKWPAKLTSESIDLSIPDEYHDNLLLYAVLKRLERREFGENRFMTSEYERLLKRFRTRTNKVARQSLDICWPRDF